LATKLLEGAGAGAGAGAGVGAGAGAESVALLGSGPFVMLKGGMELIKIFEVLYIIKSCLPESINICIIL